MRTNSAPLRVGWIASLITGIGCAGPTGGQQDALWRAYREASPPDSAGYQGAKLFAGAAQLKRTTLIRAVLARNPSVQAAREGLRAALAAIPQATAFDDPTLGYQVAPLSVTGAVPFGNVVSIRQKLPFPGKRRLAGEVALARAAAEAADLDAVRLDLAQAASELYDDYYVTARALAINAHHHALFEQIKNSAAAEYVAGRAGQQDPIQAEVELARLARERLALESERDQIVARIDGLLHRPPAAALPPPPRVLAAAAAPSGTSAELQQLALRRRPQRAAARARIDAASAEIAVAQRAYYPDFEVMASYDSMWDVPEHRWMVGVMIDVPIFRGKRRAAVDQARAATARAWFEDERLADDIRVEVDRAHRRVIEAEALVAVDERQLVPAARAQADAALAGFTAAQTSFVAVVDAHKNLRDAELELELELAELSRRRAALARAVGIIPGLPDRAAVPALSAVPALPDRGAR